MAMKEEVAVGQRWLLRGDEVIIVSIVDNQGRFHYKKVDPSKDQTIRQVHCSWLRRCKWEHDIKTNIEVLSLLHKKRC